MLEPRRQTKTIQLKVPRVDWAAVIAGEKTQWRDTAHGPQFDLTDLPRPVVLHSYQKFRRDAEARLAVLESAEREPLGAISPESLAAEGMASLSDFRKYWIERHKRVGYFMPLTTVMVYTVRPWQPDDREHFADKLLTYLYGPWL